MLQALLHIRHDRTEMLQDAVTPSPQRRSRPNGESSACHQTDGVGLKIIFGDSETDLCVRTNRHCARIGCRQTPLGHIDRTRSRYFFVLAVGQSSRRKRCGLPAGGGGHLCSSVVRSTTLRKWFSDRPLGRHFVTQVGVSLHPNWLPNLLRSDGRPTHRLHFALLGSCG